MEISEKQRREEQVFERIKRSSLHENAIATVVHYQRPEERSRQMILLMSTMIGAAVLALAADQLSPEVDVFTTVSTVASGTWMTARFLLKSMCMGCVKELKKQHPARVHLILNEFRTRVSHLASVVNEVEKKLFPEEK